MAQPQTSVAHTVGPAGAPRNRPACGLDEGHPTSPPKRLAPAAGPPSGATNENELTAAETAAAAVDMAASDGSFPASPSFLTGVALPEATQAASAMFAPIEGRTRISMAMLLDAFNAVVAQYIDGVPLPFGLPNEQNSAAVGFSSFKTSATNNDARVSDRLLVTVNELETSADDGRGFRALASYPVSAALNDCPSARIGNYHSPAVGNFRFSSSSPGAVPVFSVHRLAEAAMASAGGVPVASSLSMLHHRRQIAAGNGTDGNTARGGGQPQSRQEYRIPRRSLADTKSFLPLALFLASYFDAVADAKQLPRRCLCSTAWLDDAIDVSSSTLSPSDKATTKPSVKEGVDWKPHPPVAASTQSKTSAPAPALTTRKHVDNGGTGPGFLATIAAPPLEPQRWFAGEAVAYDETTRLFHVKVVVPPGGAATGGVTNAAPLAPGTVVDKFVSRAAVCFEGEDPAANADAVRRANNDRRFYEKRLRLDLYLAMIGDDSTERPLSDAILRRILRSATRGMSSASQAAIAAHVDCVKREYVLGLREARFVYFALSAHNRRLLAPLDVLLPGELSAPDAAAAQEVARAVALRNAEFRAVTSAAGAFAAAAAPRTTTGRDPVRGPKTYVRAMQAQLLTTLAWREPTRACLQAMNFTWFQQALDRLALIDLTPYGPGAQIPLQAFAADCNASIRAGHNVLQVKYTTALDSVMSAALGKTYSYSFLGADAFFASELASVFRAIRMEMSRRLRFVAAVALEHYAAFFLPTTTVPAPAVYGSVSDSYYTVPGCMPRYEATLLVGLHATPTKSSKSLPAMEGNGSLQDAENGGSFGGGGGSGAAVLVPSLDAASMTLRTVVLSAVRACGTILRLENTVMSTLRLPESFVPSVEPEEASVEHALCVVDAAVRASSGVLQTLVAVYGRLAHFDALSSDETLYFPPPPAVADTSCLDRDLRFLQERAEAITWASPNCVHSGIFCVDVSHARSTLLACCDDHRTRLFALVEQRVERLAHLACCEFAAMDERLNRRPTTAEEMQDLMGFTAAALERVSSVETTECRQVLALIQLCERFLHLLPEAVSDKVNEMFAWPALLDARFAQSEECVLREREAMIAELAAYRVSVNETVAAIAETVEALHAVFEADRADDTLKTIQSVRCQLEEVERRIDVLNQREDIFDMPRSAFELLPSLTHAFGALEQFWTVFLRATYGIQAYLEQSLATLHADQFTDDVETWRRLLRAACRSLRGFPHITALGRRTEAMLARHIETTSVAQALKGPGMRVAHWKELGRRIGLKDAELHPSDQTMTLTRLAQLGVHRHLHVIEEIARLAAQEHGEEQRLESLRAECRAIHLVFQPIDDASGSGGHNNNNNNNSGAHAHAAGAHGAAAGNAEHGRVANAKGNPQRRPSPNRAHPAPTGLRVLTNAVETITMLDQQIAAVQQLRSSPFIGSHLSQAVEWEHSMVRMQETLNLWQHVQAQWMQLRPVIAQTHKEEEEEEGVDEDRNHNHHGNGRNGTNHHSKSHGAGAAGKGGEGVSPASVESVAEQDPIVADFQHADVAFRALVDEVDRPSNTLYTIMLLESLPIRLSDTAATLRSVRLGVLSLMDAKRVVFPRFFFASNDDLLSCLSAANLNAVSALLPKLYYRLSSLESTRNEVIGFVAADGTHLRNDTPLVASNEPIETWLSRMDKALTQSIVTNLELSMRDFGKKPLREWIFRWNGQLVDLVHRIRFAQDLEELVSVSGGKGLQAYAKRMNRVLQEYFAISEVRSTMRASDMKTIASAIICNMHQRETVLAMIDEGVGSVDEMAAFPHFRTTLSENGNEVSVSYMHATAKYGFEFMGGHFAALPTLPFVEAQRALFLGGVTSLASMVVGNQVAGKSTLVADTARLLGRMLWTVQCLPNESTPFEHVACVLRGCLTIGAWIAIDDIDLWGAADAFRLLQLLQRVGDARRAGAQHVLFSEGVDSRVDPNFTLVATSRHAFAALPSHIVASFRPVHLHPIDWYVAARLQLCANGFESVAIPMGNRLGALFTAGANLDALVFSVRTLQAIVREASAENTRTSPEIQLARAVFLLIPTGASPALTAFVRQWVVSVAGEATAATLEAAAAALDTRMSTAGATRPLIVLGPVFSGKGGAVRTYVSHLQATAVLHAAHQPPPAVFTIVPRALTASMLFGTPDVDIGVGSNDTAASNKNNNTNNNSHLSGDALGGGGGGGGSAPVVISKAATLAATSAAAAAAAATRRRQAAKCVGVIEGIATQCAAVPGRINVIVFDGNIDGMDDLVWSVLADPYRRPIPGLSGAATMMTPQTTVIFKSESIAHTTPRVATMCAVVCTGEPKPWQAVLEGELSQCEGGIGGDPVARAAVIAVADIAVPSLEHLLAGLPFGGGGGGTTSGAARLAVAQAVLVLGRQMVALGTSVYLGGNGRQATTDFRERYTALSVQAFLFGLAWAVAGPQGARERTAVDTALRGVADRLAMIAPVASVTAADAAALDPLPPLGADGGSIFECGVTATGWQRLTAGIERDPGNARGGPETLSRNVSSLGRKSSLEHGPRRSVSGLSSVPSPRHNRSVAGGASGGGGGGSSSAAGLDGNINGESQGSHEAVARLTETVVGPDIPVADQRVMNRDLSVLSAVLERFMSLGVAVVVGGERRNGSSSLLRAVINAYTGSSVAVHALAVSSGATPADVAADVAPRLGRRKAGVYGPLSGKRLVLCVDDLHLCGRSNSSWRPTVSFANGSTVPLDRSVGSGSGSGKVGAFYPNQSGSEGSLAGAPTEARPVLELLYALWHHRLWYVPAAGAVSLVDTTLVVCAKTPTVSTLAGTAPLLSAAKMRRALLLNLPRPSPVEEEAAALAMLLAATGHAASAALQQVARESVRFLSLVRGVSTGPSPSSAVAAFAAGADAVNDPRAAMGIGTFSPRMSIAEALINRSASITLLGGGPLTNPSNREANAARDLASSLQAEALLQATALVLRSANINEQTAVKAIIAEAVRVHTATEAAVPTHVGAPPSTAHSFFSRPGGGGGGGGGGSNIANSAARIARRIDLAAQQCFAPLFRPPPSSEFPTAGSDFVNSGPGSPRVATSPLRADPSGTVGGGRVRGSNGGTTSGALGGTRDEDAETDLADFVGFTSVTAGPDVGVVLYDEQWLLERLHPDEAARRFSDWLESFNAAPPPDIVAPADAGTSPTAVEAAGTAGSATAMASGGAAAVTMTRSDPLSSSLSLRTRATVGALNNSPGSGAMAIANGSLAVSATAVAASPLVKGGTLYATSWLADLTLRVVGHLQQPGLNVALIGSAAFGLARLSALAFHVTGFDTMLVGRGAARYTAEHWRRDLRHAMRLAARRDARIGVFVPWDVVHCDAAVLQAVDGVSRGGAVLGLFTGEELTPLLDLVRLDEKADPQIALRRRLQENLRFVLHFRSRADFDVATEHHPALQRAMPQQIDSAFRHEQLFELGAQVLEEPIPEATTRAVIGDALAEVFTELAGVRSKGGNAHPPLLPDSATTTAKFMALCHFVGLTYRRRVPQVRAVMQSSDALNATVAALRTELEMLRERKAALAPQFAELVARILDDEVEVSSLAEKTQQLRKEFDKLEADAVVTVSAIESKKHAIAQVNDGAVAIVAEAKRALAEMDVKQVTNLRLTLSPPQKIKQVMEAMCLLIGERPERTARGASGDYWALARRLMEEPDFLHRLTSISLEPVSSLPSLERLAPYLEAFETTRYGNVSVFAQAVADFVLAIASWLRSHAQMTVLQDEVDNARLFMLDTVDDLERRRDALAEENRRLVQCRSVLEMLRGQRARLQSEIDACNRRYNNAFAVVSLIEKLTSRWEGDHAKAQALSASLVGSIICTGVSVMLCGGVNEKTECKAVALTRDVLARRGISTLRNRALGSAWGSIGTAAEQQQQVAPTATATSPGGLLGEDAAAGVASASPPSVVPVTVDYTAAIASATLADDTRPLQHEVRGVVLPPRVATVLGAVQHRAYVQWPLFVTASPIFLTLLQQQMAVASEDCIEVSFFDPSLNDKLMQAMQRGSAVVVNDFTGELPVAWRKLLRLPPHLHAVFRREAAPTLTAAPRGASTPPVSSLARGSTPTKTSQAPLLHTDSSASVTTPMLFRGRIIEVHRSFSLAFVARSEALLIGSPSGSTALTDNLTLVVIDDDSLVEEELMQRALSNRATGAATVAAEFHGDMQEVQRCEENRARSNAVVAALLTTHGGALIESERLIAELTKEVHAVEEAQGLGLDARASATRLNNGRRARWARPVRTMHAGIQALFAAAAACAGTVPRMETALDLCNKSFYLNKYVTMIIAPSKLAQLAEEEQGRAVSLTFCQTLFEMFASAWPTQGRVLFGAILGSVMESAGLEAVGTSDEELVAVGAAGHKGGSGTPLTGALAANNNSSSSGSPRSATTTTSPTAATVEPAHNRRNHAAGHGVSPSAVPPCPPFAFVALRAAMQLCTTTSGEERRAERCRRVADALESRPPVDAAGNPLPRSARQYLSSFIAFLRTEGAKFGSSMVASEAAGGDFGGLPVWTPGFISSRPQSGGAQPRSQPTVVLRPLSQAPPATIDEMRAQFLETALVLAYALVLDGHCRPPSGIVASLSETFLTHTRGAQLPKRIDDAPYTGIHDLRADTRVAMAAAAAAGNAAAPLLLRCDDTASTMRALSRMCLAQGFGYALVPPVAAANGYAAAFALADALQSTAVTHAQAKATTWVVMPMRSSNIDNGGNNYDQPQNDPNAIAAAIELVIATQRAHAKIVLAKASGSGKAPAGVSARLANNDPSSPTSSSGGGVLGLATATIAAAEAALAGSKGDEQDDSGRGLLLWILYSDGDALANPEAFRVLSSRCLSVAFLPTTVREEALQCLNIGPALPRDWRDAPGASTTATAASLRRALQAMLFLHCGLQERSRQQRSRRALAWSGVVHASDADLSALLHLLREGIRLLPWAAREPALFARRLLFAFLPSRCSAVVDGIRVKALGDAFLGPALAPPKPFAFGSVFPAQDSDLAEVAVRLQGLNRDLCEVALLDGVGPTSPTSSFVQSVRTPGVSNENNNDTGAGITTFSDMPAELRSSPLWTFVESRFGLARAFATGASPTGDAIPGVTAVSLSSLRNPRLFLSLWLAHAREALFSESGLANTELQCVALLPSDSGTTPGSVSVPPQAPHSLLRRGDCVLLGARLSHQTFAASVVARGGATNNRNNGHTTNHATWSGLSAVTVSALGDANPFSQLQNVKDPVCHTLTLSAKTAAEAIIVMRLVVPDEDLVTASNAEVDPPSAMSHLRRGRSTVLPVRRGGSTSWGAPACGQRPRCDVFRAAAPALLRLLSLADGSAQSETEGTTVATTEFLLERPTVVPPGQAFHKVATSAMSASVAASATSGGAPKFAPAPPVSARGAGGTGRRLSLSTASTPGAASSVVGPPSPPIVSASLGRGGALAPSPLWSMLDSGATEDTAPPEDVLFHLFCGSCFEVYA